jgi:hypothetical protein
MAAAPTTNLRLLMLAISLFSRFDDGWPHVFDPYLSNSPEVAIARAKRWAEWSYWLTLK